MSKKTASAKKAGIYHLSLLLLLGSFSNIGYAQATTTAKVSITVVDPQNAVVADATGKI